MNNKISEIIKGSPQNYFSPEEQKELLNYLKSIPESEAYEIIKDMLDSKSNIPFTIVKSVLNQREYVIKLFKYGLLNCNSQSIKLWLEFAIPKLGFKSVVFLIEELDNQKNQLADIALYWLPMFSPKDNAKSVKLIEMLEDKVEKRQDASNIIHN